MGVEPPEIPDNTANGYKLELLQYSYWEHFKFEKDIAFVLPIDHPKRVKMRHHTNQILEEIHKIQNKE